MTYQQWLGLHSPVDLGFRELDESVRTQDWIVVWATQHPHFSDADLGAEIALGEELRRVRDAVEYFEAMLKKPS